MGTETIAPAAPGSWLHRESHRANRDLLEIDAGHGLLDLQRARLARFGVDVIPVVQAKRDVAVLLHLEYHDVGERVNRPGLSRKRRRPPWA